MINLFCSFGVGGCGVIPGLENDRYGIGWYFIDFPGSFKTLRMLDAETGIDEFYNFAITPWAQLTADVQWVHPPGRLLMTPGFLMEDCIYISSTGFKFELK